MLLDSAGSSLGGAVEGFIILALFFAWYFIPTFVARGRHTVNLGAVFVVNVFLGWTVLGWVVAIAMAVGGMTRTHAALHQPPDLPPGTWPGALGP